MIAEWMLYQCATALLLGLAALAAERLVVVRGWPRRGIWAVSLGVCLILPGLAALKPPPAPNVDVLPAAAVPHRQSALSDVDVHQNVAEKVVVPFSVGDVFPQSLLAVRAGSTIQTLQRPVEWVWAALTLSILSLYAFATWSLLRRARHWPRQNVGGCTVRIAPAIGPAVLGYIRPEIVLPKWLLTASANELRLVLAHERAHVRARDSLLWLFALLAFALVPWSIPMAWQVRRLRFAIEVDCDARVIRSGVGLHEYGHTLLAVSQRRTRSPLGALPMTARRSVLERRLSILAAAKPVNMWLIGALIGLCACCFAVAAALPVPRDASDSVIEPPPAYSSPFFLAAAESAARSAYPAVFRGDLTGTVSIRVDLGIDGQVFRMQRRDLAPGPLSEVSLPFDEETEVHDVYRVVGSASREFLGWFGPHHDDGLYLSYRVLKWAPDPTRTAARVRAAVAVSFPEFFRAYPRNAQAPFTVITVFMNEDGTIKRSSLTRLSTHGPGNEERLGYQRLIDLGLSPAQFAHRGTTGNWQDPVSRLKFANAPPLMIDYAWPRRPGDPPDEITQEATVLKHFQYGAKSNPADEQLPDSVLLKRFFPAVFEHGADWPNEMLWIVLDRAGKVWATGKSENLPTTMVGIQALYPGITVESGRARDVETSVGTPVGLSMWWLGADSAALVPKAVNVPGRADLLVMLRIMRNDHVVAETLMPLKVGVPAEHRVLGGQAEITASAAGPHSADISVHIASADTSLLPIAQPWSSRVVHVSYGDKATFALSANDGQKWRAVLSPIRMPLVIE